MQSQFIVVFGNPADGYEYVGPFASGDAARAYAERHLGAADWWVILLQEPAIDD